LGESYTVGGKVLDMRAEVGLLTRNIKIIGNSNKNIILVNNDDELANIWNAKIEKAHSYVEVPRPEDSEGACSIFRFKLPPVITSLPV